MVSGVAAVLLVGCTSYHNVNSYMVPNWTPDGKIIAMRVEQTMASGPFITEQSIGGRLSIVKMNDDGSNEQELMEINEQSVMLLVGSPQGNYLAYIDANGNLKVFQNEGGWKLKWSKGLGRSALSIFEMSFNDNETHIMINVGYSQILIYSVTDAALVYQNADGQGAPGVWKTGTSFYFFDNNLNQLVLFDFQSNQSQTLGFRMFPESYSASENALYYQSTSFEIGAYRVRMNLDNGSTTTTNFSYAPYEYHDFVDQHLSPDGKKLVMARDIGLYPQGIYILNVEQSTVEQLR